MRENRRFTISLLSQKFLQVFRSVLYKTVTEQNNCAQDGHQKLSRRSTKTALKCFERYDAEGDNLLNKIDTGDETWVA